MIPIEQIVNIIKVRDELQLDGAASEILSFLEENGHLKRKS